MKAKRERLFFDESRLNSKKANLSVKPFLLEMEGGMTQFEKWKRDPDIPIYLTGIIQSGDKPNRNGRIYPWEYLKRECIRYMENEVKNGLSFSELDHPADSNTPQLKNACATVEDIWFKGKDVYGKVKVLNAYMPETAPGKMVRGIILNGKSVGISSRALGSIDEARSGQYDVIDEDLEMICWDIVSNASNFGSEKLDLSESKQMLTESQLFTGHKTNKIQEVKFETLTESEKTFLNIMGVEKFLRISSRFQK